MIAALVFGFSEANAFFAPAATEHDGTGLHFDRPILSLDPDVP